MLARVYGVMPWHIDGEPWLTYSELRAFVDDLENRDG